MTSMTQVNTPNGRFYQVGDVLYPSVTTILQATMPKAEQKRLEQWRQKKQAFVGADIDSRSDAAARGTKIHELIAAQLQGKHLECPQELLEFWNPIRHMIPAIGALIAIESAVYHPHLSYAGTLDLIASWQGQLTIFDWKTSHRIKRLEWMGDAALQVTAYKAAFECLLEIEVEQAQVVVISPNRIQLFEIEATHYWEAWLQRLEAYYSNDK